MSYIANESQVQVRGSTKMCINSTFLTMTAQSTGFNVKLYRY